MSYVVGVLAILAGTTIGIAACRFGTRCLVVVPALGILGMRFLWLIRLYLATVLFLPHRYGSVHTSCGYIDVTSILLIALILVRLLKGYQISHRNRRIFLIACGFLVVNFVSVLLAMAGGKSDPGATVRASLASILPISILFFWPSGSAGEPRGTAIFLAILSIPLALSGLVSALAPRLVSTFLEWEHVAYVQAGVARLQTTFGGPGTTGAALAALVPLHLTLSKSKWWARVGLVLICLAIILTFSRSVIVGLVAGVYSYILTTGEKRGWIVWVISACLVFILSCRGVSLARYIGLYLGSGGTDLLRLYSAKAALSVWGAFPLLGSGLGAVYDRQGIARTVEIQGIHSAADPHNLYLLILSESGILGLLFWATLVVTALSPSSREGQSVIISSIRSGVVCLLGYSLFSATIQTDPRMGAFFWTMVALAQGGSEVRREQCGS